MKKKTYFIIETVFIIIFFCLSNFYLKSDFTLTNDVFVCGIFYYTGFYCPGCGGTRAVENLLRLNFIKSAYYHPIVLFGFGVLIISWISYILNFVTKGKIKIYEIHIRHVVYMDAILIIWFVLRNMLIYFFNLYLY